MAALGAAASLGSKGLRQGASLLKRRMLIDVEISIRDPSYTWFLQWMTMHQRQRLAQDAQNRGTGLMESIVQKLTPRVRHLSIETAEKRLPNGTVQANFTLVPGPGKHIIRYRGAFIMVERVRETKAFPIQQTKPWETVTLTTLFSHRHVFSDMFFEAHEHAQQAIEGRTMIFHPETAGWKQFGEPRRKRGLDSVILDKGIAESIVGDVQDFLASAQWYYDRGIPYRRGYLLHGPPGTGKTSFIQALAGEIGYNIAVLNLSGRGMTDDRLQLLLTLVPARSIVLLEDADAAFTNRRTQVAADGYQGANVTFSGLLNALDGVGSSEERIVFLTTNHIDRMDPALVRPGRVDMIVRLGDASRWQIERFWDRFYGHMDATHIWRIKFIQQLEHFGILADESKSRPAKHPISTAALQGLFLYNKNDMEGAVKMIKELVPDINIGKTELHNPGSASVGAG